MARRAPSDCTSMAELREAIDAVDKDLIALLTVRSTYIDRAAELKRDNGLPANIPDRVEDVVEKVRATSEGAGFDPNLAEELYRIIIQWSIEREEEQLRS